MATSRAFNKIIVVECRTTSQSAKEKQEQEQEDYNKVCGGKKGLREACKTDGHDQATKRRFDGRGSAMATKAISSQLTKANTG